jgi:prepilin-type N-terminal cleavage/methylation domain-containing protein
MRGRLDRQDGFVLTELLLVMVIGTLLLGATLLTFERFVRNANRNDLRNDRAEMARRGLDLQAKQLRNLAKRINTGVIDTVQEDQLIFQTSDPTRTWVRYCLNADNPFNAKVYQQNQSQSVAAAGAPVTSAMRSGCPSTSGWSETRLVAENVVNRMAGLDKPMFTYQCASGGTSCTSGPAFYDQIIGIDATLYVNPDPDDDVDDPGTERVSSGVYLRNQNQPPVAEFSATALTGQSRTVLLNGSGSSDFEQRTLAYYWFLGTMPVASQIRCDQPGDPNAASLWGGNIIGRELTVQYTWPGTSPATGSPQVVGLVVCDPGDRASAVVTKTVTIPA